MQQLENHGGGGGAGLTRLTWCLQATSLFNNMKTESWAALLKIY